ncbi:MAG: U32 family peptidase [Desulfobacteraceae bacterium]|nr:U32 family peptidase [Desulfobacteraceae bacterium]
MIKKMTQQHRKKVELLAPAGNLEKLEIVLNYGADAVYLAGKSFSLRNFSENFTLEEMKTAVDMAHRQNRKVYVAVNSFLYNEDLSALKDYLIALQRIEPDGIIIADPGVLTLSKTYLPDIPIHLSTQANTSNTTAASFWKSQGIRRINAARELSLSQIAHMAQLSGLQVEAFVHGAMCISYSGRCLLSNYMAGRSSNQGMCCHPCRYNYALVEELRPGQYFPIMEDEKGAYILNSRDLCMLAHLPDMIRTGVRALKIEGRMKGINYAATTVKIYREAIDRYYDNPSAYELEPYWQSELDKITSRGYCTGFYMGDPSQVAPRYQSAHRRQPVFAGKVLGPAAKNKACIEVRNKIHAGQKIEIIKPRGPIVIDTINHIMDDAGNSVKIAQPGSKVTISISSDCKALDLLRISSA